MTIISEDRLIELRNMIKKFHHEECVYVLFSDRDFPGVTIGELKNLIMEEIITDITNYFALTRVISAGAKNDS